jgi:peroxiredoxin
VTTTITLQAELDALAQQLATSLPAEALQAFDEQIRQLAAEGAAGHKLKVGDQAPDFSLPRAGGGTVTLVDLLRQGPVVLTFYRGEWCPYCNLTLRGYQQALPDFQRYGATLVAISPQTPDNSLTTVEQKALSYPVLSDVGNIVARQYHLVYAVGARHRAALSGLGVDLAQFNGTENWELPLAGTFVIGQDGIITLAFASADWRQRLEPAAIVQALAAQTNGAQ